MDTGSIVSESYPYLNQFMDMSAIGVPIPNPPSMVWWTPVSAGQPKEDKEYLCTVKWSNDLTVMELQWNDGKWTDREHMDIFDVIAYAPLPEPYRRKDD